MGEEKSERKQRERGLRRGDVRKRWGTGRVKKAKRSELEMARTCGEHGENAS